MAENLEERKADSDDGVSTVAHPVTPEGGKAKQSPTGADKKKKVDPKADEVEDGVTKVSESEEKDDAEYEKKANKDDDDGEEEMEENFDMSSLFEGLDLSEDFKEKASLVFEAAVNEEATKKASKLAEEIEKDLSEEFETSLAESLDEIIENLDGYLDYIVKEWMEENEVGIESGIKVEMAESLMNGLKDLFEEHNVDVSEETVDVVAELEEELEEIKESANKAINSRIQLEEEVQTLRANKVFEELTEGLSAAQVERFRVLSEKIDNSDLDEYKEDLSTLKESFFKEKKETVISEDLNSEGEEIITEDDDSAKKNLSQYDSVNAYAQALRSIK